MLRQTLILVLLCVVAVGVVSADHPGNETDTTKPYIEFDEPVTTNGSQQLPEPITVTSGQAAISGTLVDESSIRRVTITLETEHPDVTREQRRRNKNVPTYTKAYQLNEPGDSFRQRIRVGNDKTTLNLSVVDMHGNYQLYRSTLRMNDTTAPALIEAQNYVKDGRRFLRFRARDDTNLQRLRVHHAGRWQIAHAIDNPFLRSGRVASKGVITSPKTEVLVEAVDVAGNRNRRVFEYGHPTDTPKPSATPTETPTATQSPTPSGGRVTAAGSTPTPTDAPGKRPADSIDTPASTTPPEQTPADIWQPGAPGNLVLVVGALFVGGGLLMVGVKL
jgi:hypothetical protein